MKEKKPIEDMAQMRLDTEVLSHLPEELKNRLLAIVAIRSSYKYKGPNYRFNLIDNGALPTAYLNLENQRLRKENRNLQANSVALASSVAFYKGLAEGLSQKILRK
jgi:hypothetical protein